MTLHGENTRENCKYVLTLLQKSVEVKKIYAHLPIGGRVLIFLLQDMMAYGILLRIIEQHFLLYGG